MQVNLARAYDLAKGQRKKPAGRVVLVDRMWPRGIKKAALSLDVSGRPCGGSCAVTSASAGAGAGGQRRPSTLAAVSVPHSRSRRYTQEWSKEVAPSAELRQWFSHDPSKWPQFETRYAAELDANEAAWRPLLQAARDVGRGGLMLVYAAKDEAHNNATALQAYLQRKAAEEGKGGGKRGGSRTGAAAGSAKGKARGKGAAGEEAPEGRRAKRTRRAEE